jgi:hypothetical protein
VSKPFFYLFPILFTALAAFYAWIAISILVRRKPVVIASNVMAIMISAIYIPLIAFQLTQYSGDSRLGLWQLLSPVAFAFLLVVMILLLRGFSAYGFGSEGFRKMLFLALDRLNARAEEELGKLRLPDHGTELQVTYQERLGTAIVKSKDQKKFDARLLRKALIDVVREHEVEVKPVTAYVYLGFAVLMLGFSGFFVWTALENLI